MRESWQRWYPHDIASWNSSAGVQSFTDAAYRAFHMLLMAQFESEDGMLPDDPRQLAKLSRMGVRWMEPRAGYSTIAEEVMEEFEAAPNGRLYNSRMYQEWKRARDVHEGRKRGGKTRAGATRLPSGQLATSSPGDKLDSDACDDQESKTHIQVQVQRQNTKAKATPPAVALPVWIPQAPWDAFCEMRQKLRAPLTGRAIALTIAKLEKLRADGQDPGAVLEQSVERAWRGVFALKGDGHGTNGGSSAAAREERNRRATYQAAAELGWLDVGDADGADEATLASAGNLEGADEERPARLGDPGG